MIFSSELTEGPIVQMILVRMDIVKIYHFTCNKKRFILEKDYMLRKFFWTVLASFEFLNLHIQAEVVKVNVQWQPETCTMECVKLLAAQFQKIPGVAQIIMNQPGGTAELRWKPGFPFVYAQVKTAMQMVGPGIRDIRVKVRGTIGFQKQTVTLTSLGDNTVFFLLGPVTPQQGKMDVYYSLESHQLSPDMLNKLMQGAQQNRIAVIEGPLFEPWRYPYLWLIVSQLNFVQSESTAP